MIIYFGINSKFGLESLVSAKHTVTHCTYREYSNSVFPNNISANKKQDTHNKNCTERKVLNQLYLILSLIL